MKLFTELYVELDQTNKTNEKVEAMRFYFEQCRSGGRRVGVLFSLWPKAASDRAFEVASSVGDRSIRGSGMALRRITRHCRRRFGDDRLAASE